MTKLCWGVRWGIRRPVFFLYRLVNKLLTWWSCRRSASACLASLCVTREPVNKDD